MPSSFNGIGSTFYGVRNWRPDGSYCTTEWFIFVNYPIFPIKSLRVVRNLKGDGGTYFYDKKGYYVLEELPLNKMQVLSTYLFSNLWLAWGICMMVLFFRQLVPAELGAFMMFALVLGFLFAACLPYLLLNYFRLRAMAKAR
ncbi:MAG TPA: hypothetical protein VFW00_05965 [Rhodocyclaceae bacterium]|nr:hypothetical protein [Rhodocyclaceae bacterium]